MSTKRMTTWAVATATLLAALVAGSPAVAGPIGIVDNFSVNSAGSYTRSLILDQNATDNSTLDIAAGVLRVTKDSGTEAEQNVFLRNDVSLGIGEVLRADVSAGAVSGNQDLGIAIANTVDPVDAVWTSGTADVRKGVLYSYVKGNSAQVRTDSYSSTGAALGNTIANIALNTVTGLYIKRTGSLGFDAGYSTTSGDVLVKSYVVDDANFGTAVGFYTDMRAVATFGSLDNLRIVPEPNSLVLGMLSLVGIAPLWKRRARA
jgi:hypothetical protein